MDTLARIHAPGQDIEGERSGAKELRLEAIQDEACRV